MKTFNRWEFLESWAQRKQSDGALLPGSDFSVLFEETPTTVFLCFDGRVNSSCFH